MVKLGLALLVTSIVPAVALAQTTPAPPSPVVGGRYKRHPDVQVHVDLTEPVKAIDPKQHAVAGPAPEVSADKILQAQGSVGTIRVEQEQILVDLIARTPDADADEKSDYYFRLAEIYALQQRFFRLEEQEAAIAADKAQAPADKARLAGIANKQHEQAKSYMINAVKAYEALTGNAAFHNFARMDLALFDYGYTLQSGHYSKEARDVYDRLLKNYPGSKYVPEAHLAFADYFFETNQLDDAEARYLKVLEFPTSTPYWYAKYKLAWVQLDKRKVEQALQAFFEVAQASKRDSKLDLLGRASKKDFVRAYAEIGKADQAYNAFARVDASYALAMLRILADLYLEQGKSDKAIYTYRDLVKRAPNDKDVCLWQYDVAHAMLSLRGATTGDKVTEIVRLNRLWGALAAKAALPTAEKQECHDNAAAMSGELARAYHSEAVKTNNPETLGYAQQLYEVYLAEFPDAEDYPQTQYYDAELLWARAVGETNPRLASAMWIAAANAFTAVVRAGKVDRKLMKESAFAAVLGWKNALDLDPAGDTKRAEREDEDCYRKKCEPEAIPDAQQNMLAAFDIYIDYIKGGNDDELVAMKFHKANTYRRYHHYAEAIPIFQDILDHHSEHETAEFSANLLLDIYNQQQQYGELRRARQQAREHDRLHRRQERAQSAPARHQGHRPPQGGRDVREDRARHQRQRQVRRVRAGLPRHLQRQPTGPERLRGPLQLRRQLPQWALGRPGDPRVREDGAVLPEGAADAEGDRAARRRVRRHRVLRPSVRSARAIRAAIRRRERRVRRDEQRGGLPQGPR